MSPDSEDAKLLKLQLRIKKAAPSDLENTVTFAGGEPNTSEPLKPPEDQRNANPSKYQLKLIRNVTNTGMNSWLLIYDCILSVLEDTAKHAKAKIQSWIRSAVVLYR